MLKTWHVYDKASGIFTGTILSFTTRKATDDIAPEVRAGLHEGHDAIAGVTDHFSQRVEGGKLVDYIPPAPSEDHEWSSESKRWVLKKEVQDKINRRTTALQKIDLLESQQPRIFREMSLNKKGAAEKLQAIEDEIVDLRKDL